MDAITWDPSRNGIDDIWPAGAGVFATTVTIQPDSAAGDGAMLATVMWNGDFLAEVYRPARVG